MLLEKQMTGKVYVWALRSCSWEIRQLVTTCGCGADFSPGIEDHSCSQVCDC